MHRNARRGKSLIELLIGIAVGAIFVIGAATAIVPSLRVGTQAGTVQAEAQLGQELLGNVKAWANGNWGSVLAIATGTANKYYLNTATSPFTAVGTSTSGEAITMSGSSGFGYAYSRAITVGSNASGTQTNFPMLVSSTLPSWASVAHGGHVQNVVTAPNGGTEAADLVFATSSANCGVSNLNFETESYSSSTGALVDWVNVPSLSAGSVIYACYGNAAVTTDQSNPAGTWNSNYVGVWDLPNGSTLSAIDSTGNGNNGTIVNSPSATGGQIDGAASFNAPSLSYITIPSNSNLQPATMTLEFWILPSASSQPNEWARYIQKGQDDTNPYGSIAVSAYIYTSNDVILQAAFTSNFCDVITEPLSTSQWSSLVEEVSGGTVYGFVNGSNDPSNFMSGNSQNTVEAPSYMMACLYPLGPAVSMGGVATMSTQRWVWMKLGYRMLSFLLPGSLPNITTRTVLRRSILWAASRRTAPAAEVVVQ